MKFSPQPKVVKKTFDSLSIPKLKKNLDLVFNEYIRLRDKGQSCISCGFPRELQAGHYHSCRYLSIRWDERNVNCQCISCNIFNQGNFHGYTKGMLKKYGQKVIDELEIRRHNKVKMSKFEYQYLINEYKEKVRKIKENNR